jgi:hypothetical protein
MGRAGLDKIVVVDLEATCWEKRERDQIMEVIGWAFACSTSGLAKSPIGEVS